MRRKYIEIVMSIGALALIVLVLASFDIRVRDAVSLRWNAGPTAQMTEAAQTARQLAAVVALAARDQGLAHAPILLFVLGAGVLVLFMVKT